MKNIPRHSIQAFSKLVGVPYKDKDCWAIVVEFYRLVFNIQLNSYYEVIPTTREEARDLVVANMKDFVEVKDPKFGDIILIQMWGVACHIAIDLGDGTMMHTTDHSGCVIERKLRWNNLIVGYYRVKESK